MKKYTYIEIATGKKVYSDIPLDPALYKEVTKIRDGRMKSSEVNQKSLNNQNNGGSQI